MQPKQSRQTEKRTTKELEHSNKTVRTSGNITYKFSTEDNEKVRCTDYTVSRKERKSNRNLATHFCKFETHMAGCYVYCRCFYTSRLAQPNPQLGWFNSLSLIITQEKTAVKQYIHYSRQRNLNLAPCKVQRKTNNKRRWQWFAIKKFATHMHNVCI